MIKSILRDFYVDYTNGALTPADHKFWLLFWGLSILSTAAIITIIQRDIVLTFRGFDVRQMVIYGLLSTPMLALKRLHFFAFFILLNGLIYRA